MAPTLVLLQKHMESALLMDIVIIFTGEWEGFFNVHAILHTYLPFYKSAQHFGITNAHTIHINQRTIHTQQRMAFASFKDV